jgi:hypothetical protein
MIIFLNPNGCLHRRPDSGKRDAKTAGCFILLILFEVRFT